MKRLASLLILLVIIPLCAAQCQTNGGTTSAPGMVSIGGFPAGGALAGVSIRGRSSGSAVWITGAAATGVLAAAVARRVRYLVGGQDNEVVWTSTNDPCQDKHPNTKMWGMVLPKNKKVYLDCRAWNVLNASPQNVTDQRNAVRTGCFW